MIFSLLNRLRKILKSIGKLEFKIIERLIYLENRSNKQSLNNNDFENLDYELEKKINHPKKLAVVVCFFFNSKKINILKKTIKKIDSYDFNTNITILTNKLTFVQKKTLNKLSKQITKKVDIYEINELPDANFLPWHSINLMKKKYIDKSISHFMFLEDDILVNKRNISYWIYFRKKLKNLNLIPGFLRYENYKKKLYAVDFQKKINLNKTPKILVKKDKFGFVNPRFLYSAMYLMDRNLMKNYLNSQAIKVDFSFTNNFLKSVAPIKELLSVSHSFLNVPKGFHHNLVLPFNKKNQFLKCCLIEHSEITYANSSKLKEMSFGKITIDTLLN